MVNSAVKMSNGALNALVSGVIAPGVVRVWSLSVDCSVLMVMIQIEMAVKSVDVEVPPVPYLIVQSCVSMVT